jgi:hypothetical protein
MFGFSCQKIEICFHFRVLWIVLCSGALILCLIFCMPIYSRWMTSPTITSVGSTNFPISNIFFPAVTICSNNRVVEKQLQESINYDP